MTAYMLTSLSHPVSGWLVTASSRNVSHGHRILLASVLCGATTGLGVYGRRILQYGGP